MSPAKTKTVGVLMILLMATALLVGLFYHIRERQQYFPENATYVSGLKSVSIEDEYMHDIPNMGEIWAPVYIFKDPSGVARKWGGNFENARIESITRPDNQTIRIYGHGIEFILRPETGYRKISIDANFTSSSLKDYLGWKPVKVGDETEFYAYSSKAVFWQNRGQPLTLPTNNNSIILYHYQVLGNVTLRRGGETYSGVGSFQHVWVNTNLYELQQSLGRQDAFHVFTNKFVLFIQGAVYGKSDIQDGAVYFMDDGSYDVLGKFAKGYPYQITDGPSRLSFRISAETHRGRIEIELTDSNAIPTPNGFQQAHWSSVKATLKEESVNGIVATSETIR